jgi:hypothetical protein
MKYFSNLGKKKRKKGIFIGLIETADMGATYAKAFRSLGYDTYTIVIVKNPYYTHEKYDLILSEKSKRIKGSSFFKRSLRLLYLIYLISVHFLRALNRCDIFVFISGTSFTPQHVDWAILKKFGKKIVSCFNGCDIRHWSAYSQEFDMLGLGAYFTNFCNECAIRSTCYLTPKLKTIQMAEKYCDLILSHYTLSQLLNRPYMRSYLPLILNEYCFRLPARDIPLVVHAPTNRSKKGTKYVLKAVNRLKRDGIKFEFKLIEGINNLEMRKILTNADIVIDGILGHVTGMLAFESMATGNAVLSGNMDDYFLGQGNCPVINTSPDNIYDNLKQLILDKNYRLALANTGRQYVETYHSHIIIAKRILEMLEPGGILQYDHYPNFRLKHYMLPQELLRSERHIYPKSLLMNFVSILIKANKFFNNENKDKDILYM